ncbi:DUF1441 family protein [Ferruginivarius sediminum]|uniref:DUF1441 family protein n=1 Tax=Ferruginivarius sediminum TaxID=2661937 RepID=A0A369T5E9_9PROT|nr:DUF1441 family protein [Ferruginivarius sediminum]RDD60478.1 DUF1441 family protein [Ferruginivarius sediminum]
MAEAVAEAVLGDEAYVVNMGELVELLAGSELAYSETTLRKLIDRHADFPLLERGTNGRSYKFYAPDVVAWLRKYNAEAEQERADRTDQLAQMRLDLVGGGADGAADYRLSGKQRREEYDAELAAIKLRREKGELVEAAEIERIATDAFAALRHELMALPDNLARTAGLSREVRNKVDELVRGALTRCAERLQQAEAPDDAS